MKSHSIIIYTDGSSLGNPGPGGYGCVIVFQEKGLVVELGAHARATTNNKLYVFIKMETFSFLFNNCI